MFVFTGFIWTWEDICDPYTQKLRKEVFQPRMAPVESSLQGHRPKNKTQQNNNFTEGEQEVQTVLTMYVSTKT